MRLAAALAAIVGLLLVGLAEGKRKPPGPTPTPTPTPTPEPSAPAVLKTAVVLVNFTNNQAEPFTPAEARTIAFDGPSSVAAFYLEASYGKQTIAGDVFGWWTVPYPNSPCDTLAWKDHARQMALAQGVNLDTDYDHVAFAFPYTTACQYSARVGSFYNGSFAHGKALAHELGHTIGAHGLEHASSLYCTDPAGAQVPLSQSCTRAEYGDPYDVMGGSFFHFNGWEKANLGWLTRMEVADVSGRYTIAPLEWEPASGSQLLLIRRADGSVFAVEFRQRFGNYFDTGWYFDGPDALATSGVQVRAVPFMPWEGVGVNTALVDANPDSQSGGWFFDAPLRPGQTLTDPLGGVSITTVSAGLDGAVVDVEVG